MDKSKIVRWCFAGLLAVTPFVVVAQKITLLDSTRNTSIRGLSVLNNSVAWVSGSEGWVARSLNGGATWKWTQLAPYKKLDFRDIEAFSDREAIIVSAGSPAVILKTSDGGLNWREVYRNNSPDIFLDGMTFRSQQEGIVYGDPIDGKMQLLRTTNKGETWTDISENLRERLLVGEASFAASGTAITSLKDGKLWIATGGVRSRVFYSPDFGLNWHVTDCPIIQGKSSAGIFSIAFKNAKEGAVAGGDYTIDTLSRDNMFFTSDGGRSWQKPAVSTFGYRSCISYLRDDVLVATGTSGTDIWDQNGARWRNISKLGFNTVMKARKGTLVLLAGAKGKIAKLDY